MHSCSSHAWELRLLFWKIRNSVYYEGDVGWHGSGFCQKLSAKVWAMDRREERELGKLQHFWESINLHPVGVGHILLPTIKANFCRKSDVTHDVWCLRWQNTGVGNSVLVHNFWNSYFNIKTWNYKIIEILCKIKHIIWLYITP